MSLQDEYLQQALKHAPDRELMPSDATRAAVLAYADSALQQDRETWLTRLSNFWREWFGASWHITGIGSAMATVLVVVIFWHELPDDSMRKVAAPNEQTVASETVDISTADGVASYVDKRAVAVSSAEKTVQKRSAQVTAPRKEKSSLPAVSQPPASLANEAQIATAVAPVPASAPVIQDKAVEESAPAGMMSLPEVAQPAPKAELVKKAISSAKLDGMLPKSGLQRSELANLLVEINREGGVVTANKDIQAMQLRLLALDVPSVQDKDVCAPSIVHPAVIDAKTGYNIETISVCNPSTSLLSEVEAYNQTMRNWHATHVNKQHVGE
ncbi:MAG: hypothetical protein V4440_04560 [Pseudomonadota bacterium]